MNLQEIKNRLLELEHKATEEAENLGNCPMRYEYQDQTVFDTAFCLYQERRMEVSRIESKRNRMERKLIEAMAGEPMRVVDKAEFTAFLASVPGAIGRAKIEGFSKAYLQIPGGGVYAVKTSMEPSEIAALVKALGKLAPLACREDQGWSAPKQPKWIREWQARQSALMEVATS